MPVERLRHHGIDVTDPQQFRDIGYLCHLADPDGYVIELLQHKFDENHTPDVADPALALGAPPTLGQITIRVTHIERSLGFYRDFLGMELLSRQEVAPSEFTLYFLAYTDEAPPRSDLDAVENREWLWQRPYTTIELQHVWGRDRGDFSYRTEENSPLGFRGITIAAEDRSDFRREARKAGVDIETTPAPDRTARPPTPHHVRSGRHGHPHRRPDLTSVVGKDVEQAPEGIAHIEAPYAPGLGHGAVFHLMPRLDDAAMDLVQVVDLDRQVGYGRSRTAFRCDAHLRFCHGVRREGYDPPEIHHDVHVQDVPVERPGGGDVLGTDIRHDPLDCHDRLHQPN